MIKLCVIYKKNLHGYNFKNSDMRYADIRSANLTGANLRGADMRDADMRGADIRGANLRGADMTDADMGGANLRDANLRGANLRGANLDFSVFPLWCGSLDIKTDTRLPAQLAYHFCRIECDDPLVIAAQNSLIELAKKFHRYEECGELKVKEIPEGDQ